ncbi:MAG: PorP/SprF family type IX secretion system membrane protein [Chitinophagaceae bacterium]
MKNHFTLLCFCLLGHICWAQDPHFSQFFASPLTLNPAFTGYFTGDLRVAGNYRNQWSSIATPFVTGTVSLDLGILKNVINPNDIFGVGIMALYDQTGGGGLQEDYLAVSTAYHKALDPVGNSTLGLGFQVALVQKRLDFSKLIFENQLTSQGFDPTLPNGEYFSNPQISYPDYNVGILYNNQLGDNSNVYLGASYYHISRPQESFLGGNNRISSRFTVHGGGSFPLESGIQFYTSGLFMQQGSATEIDVGGALGFLVNGIPEAPTILYLGSWYRYADALNPYVGLEVNNIRVGVSYDVNVSSLQSASMHRGGMEISLIYIQTHPQGNQKHLVCPKF